MLVTPHQKCGTRVEAAWVDAASASSPSLREPSRLPRPEDMAGGAVAGDDGNWVVVVTHSSRPQQAHRSLVRPKLSNARCPAKTRASTCECRRDLAPTAASKAGRLSTELCNQKHEHN